MLPVRRSAGRGGRDVACGRLRGDAATGLLRRDLDAGAPAAMITRNDHDAILLRARFRRRSRCRCIRARRVAASATPVASVSDNRRPEAAVEVESPRVHVKRGCVNTPAPRECDLRDHAQTTPLRDAVASVASRRGPPSLAGSRTGRARLPSRSHHASLPVRGRSSPTEGRFRPASGATPNTPASSRAPARKAGHRSRDAGTFSTVISSRLRRCTEGRDPAMARTKYFLILTMFAFALAGALAAPVPGWRRRHRHRRPTSVVRMPMRRSLPAWPDQGGGAAGTWITPASAVTTRRRWTSPVSTTRIAHNMFSINMVWVRRRLPGHVRRRPASCSVETGLCRAKNAAHLGHELHGLSARLLRLWAYGFAIGWGNWWNGRCRRAGTRPSDPPVGAELRTSDSVRPRTRRNATGAFTYGIMGLKASSSVAASVTSASWRCSSSRWCSWTPPRPSPPAAMAGSAGRGRTSASSALWVALPYCLYANWVWGAAGSRRAGSMGPSRCGRLRRIGCRARDGRHHRTRGSDRHQAAHHGKFIGGKRAGDAGAQRPSSSRERSSWRSAGSASTRARRCRAPISASATSS